jgi:hypothetical protein
MSPVVSSSYEGELLFIPIFPLCIIVILSIALFEPLFPEAAVQKLKLAV